MSTDSIHDFADIHRALRTMMDKMEGLEKYFSQWEVLREVMDSAETAREARLRDMETELKANLTKMTALQAVEIYNESLRDLECENESEQSEEQEVELRAETKESLGLLRAATKDAEKVFTASLNKVKAFDKRAAQMQAELEKFDDV